MELFGHRLAQQLDDCRMLDPQVGKKLGPFEGAWKLISATYCETDSLTIPTALVAGNRRRRHPARRGWHGTHAACFVNLSHNLLFGDF